MDRRVAVVTGGNKGIGRESARQLAREGITVFIGARDEARGREAAEKLRGEGLDARPLRLDVTDDASVAAAAARVEQDAGRLDILVNNAGIAIDDGPPSPGPDGGLLQRRGRLAVVGRRGSRRSLREAR